MRRIVVGTPALWCFLVAAPEDSAVTWTDHELGIKTTVILSRGATRRAPYVIPRANPSVSLFVFDILSLNQRLPREP